MYAMFYSRRFARQCRNQPGSGTRRRDSEPNWRSTREPVVASLNYKRNYDAPNYEVSSSMLVMYVMSSTFSISTEYKKRPPYFHFADVHCIPKSQSKVLNLKNIFTKQPLVSYIEKVSGGPIQIDETTISLANI